MIVPITEDSGWTVWWRGICDCNGLDWNYLHHLERKTITLVAFIILWAIHDTSLQFAPDNEAILKHTRIWSPYKILP